MRTILSRVQMNDGKYEKERELSSSQAASDVRFSLRERWGTMYSVSRPSL